MVSSKQLFSAVVLISGAIIFIYYLDIENQDSFYFRLPVSQELSIPSSNLTTEENYHVIFTKRLSALKETTQRTLTIYEKRQILHDGLVQSCVNKKKERRVPDIIGIGVEKCGTHALVHFLRPHPLIRIPATMESHFFDEHPGASIETYLNKLMPVEENAFLMEKTPAYFSFPPYGIPGSIKKLVPNAKILLILCEPAKRVFSDFVQEWVLHNITHGNAGIVKYKNLEDYLDVYLPRIQNRIGEYDVDSNETTSFGKSIDLLRLHSTDYLSTILTTGYYALHLQRWLRKYNQSNLMVIDGEEMFEDPGSVVEKIEDFLGLPKVLLRDDYVKDPKTGYFCYKDWTIDDRLNCLPDGKQRTRGNGPRVLSEETLNRLKLFYKSHNEGLFKMIGRRLNWD